MDGENKYLIIDVGNTRAKAMCFHGDRPMAHATFPNDDQRGLLDFVRSERPGHIAYGTVASPNDMVLSELNMVAPAIPITGSTPSPLRSRYTTPLTLGVDRLANAVAAAAIFPGRGALVIDLGSCITYDLVLPHGEYAGGAITPGVRMRAKAMHEHSARLPLVDAGEPTSPWATSTATALQAGIHHGVLGEMKSFMTMAAHEVPDLAVVLTGGDVPTFASALKTGIFAHPFLTLEGLRLILLHHLDGGGPAASKGR